MATTSNQGFLKHTQASGNAIVHVFSSLLSDLDSLLRGRGKESHSLSDTNDAQLLGGDDSSSRVVTIINQEDGHAADILLDADNSTTKIVSQNGTHFGTTNGTDAQTNVYHNSGAFHIENQAGGDRTYDVTVEGE